ncbi:hypothetical protein RD792_008093 [Penstemon davidsonii]|uniref:Glycosyltransferase n=1 Tax=Penstemon davidsonii TaxID=160366 RepID=A0ABR0D853_9LAMI|nr:hypothetical protein RD792_008093 [Penstemon davidsonii]
MANQPITSVAVVMVPLPAQGHLNQLLHLSRLVSAYDIPIHFVGTTTHTRQAKTRVHGWDPLSKTNINFHEFPTPSFNNPPPNPNSSIKFPSQIIPSLHASTNLRDPVYKLVQNLSKTTQRIVIIYDSMMAYVVQDIRSIPNAESFCFQSISAFTTYSFYWEAVGKPLQPFKACHIENATLEDCFPLEFLELVKVLHDVPKSNTGDIYNTSRLIEGTYLDLLAEAKATGTDNQFAIGPFNPISLLGTKNQENNQNKCLLWLDKQEPNSVLFVSFGTTSSLSDEQINEIAIGLEKSEHRFIWVLRDADKGDVFEGEIRKAPLPEGYEERVKERGIIVRDWAPQLEILGHGSTGGFISHCGWNSCMESISMGVPIGAWPMHSDQPGNAFLVTKVLRIGVEVKDWARRDEVIDSITVEKVVRRLMGSEEGDEIRKRAKELGEIVRESVVEGGDTKKEMDSFIAHITR